MSEISNNMSLDFVGVHGDHLSFSQISAFQKCPMYWYLGRISEVPRKFSPALQFGSNLHEMIAGKLLGKSKAVDFSFNPGFAKLAEYFVNRVDKELENIGVDLSNNFWVEQRLKVKGFVGVIDFVGQLKGSKDIVIIDWKTTSVPYNPHQIMSSDQLTCYAWLTEHHFQCLPAKVCYVTFDKRTRNILSWVSQRTERDLLEWSRKVDSIREAMKTPVWKNPESCFNVYGRCDFYQQCWSVSANDGMQLQTDCTVRRLGGKK